MKGNSHFSKSPPKSPKNGSGPQTLKKIKVTRGQSYVYLVLFPDDRKLKIVKKKKYEYPNPIINEILLQNFHENSAIEIVINQNLTMENFNLTLCEPLGFSLKYLSKVINPFSISTICLIGIRLIKILSNLHSKGLVHTQIKPSKILTSRSDLSKLLIVDMSKVFIINKDLRKKLEISGKHGLDWISRNKNLFSGRGVANGTEPTPLDDLDSVMYILLFYFNGGKWFLNDIPNYNEMSKEGKMQSLATYKLISSEECLAKQTPEKFIDFIKYIRNLRANELINYMALCDILNLIRLQDQSKISSMNIKSVKFDWETNPKILEEFTLLNNNNVQSPRNAHSNSSPRNRPKELLLKPIEESKYEGSKKKVSDKIKEFNNKQFEFKNSFNSHSQENSPKLDIIKNQIFNFEEDVSSLSPNKKDFMALIKAYSEEDFSSKDNGFSAAISNLIKK